MLRLSRLPPALLPALWLAATSACGGPRPPAATSEPTRVAPEAPGAPGLAEAPPAGADPAPSPAVPAGAALAAPNLPPELEIPPYRAVGVGQILGFGLEVIDPEADTIRVDLVERPASATYDPVTLTVVWKAARADLPAGRFVVRVTETQRATGAVRVYQHAFAIAVTTAKQPHPHAQPLSDPVELLITVHDPERLRDVNRAWPIDKMLLRAAEAELQYLPDDARAKVDKLDAAALYRSFLKAQADLHHNPRLDPAAPEFDRATYGDPRSWEIITVRPRLDKKWQELRVVYKAQRSPNAVYAMFRYRPVVDKPGLPPELRELNNKEFSRLVHESLFAADGNFKPGFAADRRAHGKAIAALVTAVMTYRHPERAEARGYLPALPNEGRLGGGSRRDAQGNYESGDGWAWGAMKPKPIARPDGGVALQWVMVPIKGWWTAVGTTSDGSAWRPVCASKFDPDDAAHTPGYEVLCRKEEGLVDMPEPAGDKLVGSKIDAVNLHLDYKDKDMVATVALRDPRRDLGEENGMSCAQCHVRRFGVRDFHDATATDPRAGTPTVANKELATTFFVIVPTETWRPYGIDFQHKQECLFDDALKTYLGVDTVLACPLRAP